MYIQQYVTHILPLNSNNVYIWRNLEPVGFFVHYDQQIKKATSLRS